MSRRIEQTHVMPERRGEAWNSEDMAVLRQMRASGKRNRDIAKALQRTEAAVSAKVIMLKRRHLISRADLDKR